MTERIVPVHVWLTPTAYRALDQYGRKHGGIPVATTLSHMADRATTPRQQYTRITPAMTDEARARLATGDTLYAIAKEFGCSKLGLRKALERTAP